MSAASLKRSSSSASSRPIQARTAANQSADESNPIGGDEKPAAPNAGSSSDNIGEGVNPPSVSQPSTSDTSGGASYGTRGFGVHGLLRLVEGLHALGRWIVFEDNVENVAAVMVVNLDDDVHVIPIGITERQLSFAFRNALQWYFQNCAIRVDLTESAYRTNGLSQESFLFNLPAPMKFVHFVHNDTYLDAVIVVSQGPTLRRVVHGAMLCVALICSAVLSYFVTRFVVEILLRDDYQDLVKSTTYYIRWCVWGVERFYHSHLLQNIVRRALRVGQNLAQPHGLVEL